MIFDSLFSTKELKISRDKTFSFSKRNYKVEEAHSKIEDYRQKHIEVAITKTIKNEYNEKKLLKIINETCDINAISIPFHVRIFLINKVMDKRDKLLNKFSLYNLEFNSSYYEKIEKFYKHPDKKIKFENIKKRKPQREHLLPERNDMIILHECLHLRNDKCRNPTILLSDDIDFTDFSEEIEKEFSIKIDPI